jgi:hypothetical protein
MLAFSAFIIPLRQLPKRFDMLVQWSNLKRHVHNIPNKSCKGEFNEKMLNHLLVITKQQFFTPLPIMLNLVFCLVVFKLK